MRRNDNIHRSDVGEKYLMCKIRRPGEIELQSGGGERKEERSAEKNGSRRSGDEMKMPNAETET
jgi:hypothetical protein